MLRVLVAILAALVLVSSASMTSAQPAPTSPNAVSVSSPPNVPVSAAPAPSTVPQKSIATGLRELSPWSMFVSASPLVQAIMLGLAFASLVTWTIFFAKLFELWTAKRRLLAALKASERARSLNESLAMLATDKSVMKTFVAVAVNETVLSFDIDNDASIKERVASSIAEIVKAEARRVRFGMGVLATVGATSPFVGLFGTVWGIMNSFIGISKAQTTNLAVVAPGIAEALLATALGLFAAIPAVVIYNHFSRVTKGYIDLVNRAAGAASRQLSRDLDRRQLAPIRRAAE